MEIINFLKKYEGQKVDFDGAYGAQCVDLFRQFNKEVLNHEHTGAVEGAKDLYLSYDNLPKMQEYYEKIPADNLTVEKGDVAIWNKTNSNYYGHVAIIVAEVENMLIVFEQDGFKQDGAKLKLRSKENLLGVLRARNV